MKPVFSRMTIAGAALLAAGLVSGSAFAEEGKSDVDANVSKVELLFLGTGAADWPSQYPPADKQLDKGEVRGMSSMLINGRLLIDCGPTVLDVMKRYDVNPADIDDILLTHTHADHFHIESILAVAEARDADHDALNFWAHPEVLKLLPESSRIEKRPVEIGKTFKVQGLEVTGLESNHRVEGSKETCLIYFFENPSVRFLYATDSSWLLTGTWRHLQDSKLDAVIWDATVGEARGDYRIFEHNDLAMIRHMNHTLKGRGVLTPDTKIILTHMARTLHPGHDELEEKLLPEGLIPAYDGMVVKLK